MNSARTPSAPNAYGSDLDRLLECPARGTVSAPSECVHCLAGIVDSTAKIKTSYILITISFNTEPNRSGMWSDGRANKDLRNCRIARVMPDVIIYPVAPIAIVTRDSVHEYGK